MQTLSLQHLSFAYYQNVGVFCNKCRYETWRGKCAAQSEVEFMHGITKLEVSFYKRTLDWY